MSWISAKASDIATELSGALLLDKPSGITSARAVARVKRLLPKGTKIGHTGTLDPLASGLLVLLLGRATRLSRYVTGLRKSYTATARFGALSDTLDADGNITPLPDASVPNGAAIDSAIESFCGEILQVPPMASAVKVGGERLYKALRRGEETKREARPVTVFSFSLIGLLDDTASFEIACSSGTYVRVLVADLAASLGTGAYVTALRRLSVHDFQVEDALTLDALESACLENHIIPPEEVVRRFLPVVSVSEKVRWMVCNGRPLEEFGISTSFGLTCGEELLAVYRDEDGRSRPEVVLCNP